MKAPFDGFDAREYPAGTCTQFFGENPALYEHMGLTAHNGIDYCAPHGTPLYAVEAGTICSVKTDPNGYGKHVRFITDGKNARLWTYAHCNAITVEVGDRVEAGDLIATMGNTGFVVSDGYAGTFWGAFPKGNRGTHLHIGLREVIRTARGWSYPESDIKIEVKNHNNGYKGSIDPYPFLKDLKSPKVSTEETKKTIMGGIITLLQKLKNKHAQ
jgi:murein DD-endopeptidase MepM/ murein hydrolase activator NlpD